MRKFRTELMLYFIVLIIVLLTIVGVLVYSWSTRIIGQKVSASTVETLKQIDKNISLILGSVRDLSLYIISNPEVRTFLKVLDDEAASVNKSELYGSLSVLPHSANYISSINIYGANGLELETGGPSWDASNGVYTAYEEKIPADGSYLITPTYQRDYQNLGPQYVISFLRQINDINNLTRRLGLLRIDINEEAINRLYKNIKLGETGYIFLVNRDGYIVSHSQKEKIAWNLRDDPDFAPVFAHREGYYHRKINGDNMFITHFTSADGNLIYVGIASVTELSKESFFIGRLIFTVILLSSLVAFFLAYLIAAKVTTPINKLIAIMEQVEDDNLDVVVDLQRKDEIGTLAASFNRMLARLKRLIDEVYKIGLMKKEAELKALQAQINPHFLYNTLDAIYWTTRREQAPVSGELIKALTKLFRLGVNKGKEITTIEKEVEHLQNYLIIQKMRYDEEPDIKIEIDPSIYPYRTIKLILQPLVENALCHGIDELDEPGMVRVTGREVNGEILFEVIDNGVGMDPAKIREILRAVPGQNSGYGLKNVDERIKLYFGENYGLKIESEPGKGTRILVRIPKLRERGDEDGTVPGSHYR